MRAIICTAKEYKIFEDLAYKGLVKDGILFETLTDEEGNQVPTYYNGMVTHRDGRIAFSVEERVEKYLPDLKQVTELSWDWFCPANKIRGHKAKQYWAAYGYDHSKLYFTGVVEVGRELATGQPHLLVADSEAELESKVDAVLGEGYYQSQKTEDE